MVNFLKKNSETIIYISLFIISIFLILIAKPYGYNSGGFGKYMDVQVLSNNWTFSDGKSEQKVSLPVNTNADVEDNITSIYSKLPDNVTDHTVICFRTSHSRVQVLVEDEVVYEYWWDEEIPIGKTPGSLWNIVELSEQHAGKKVTIKTNSIYPMYEGVFRTVIFGDKAGVLLYLQDETRPMIFLSCIPLVFGIILIIVAFLAGKELPKKPFIYVGIFLNITGIWETTESGYLQFLNFDMYVVQIVNLITFGFIPLMVIMTLKYTKFLKYYFDKMFYINVGIYIVYIGAQLLEIADMNENLWMIHGAMVIDSIFIIKDTKQYYADEEEKAGFISIMCTYTILFVAVIVDLYRIYIYPDSYNGYATRIGMTIFILLMAVSYVQRSLAAERRNVERETIISMAYTDILTGIKNRRCFEEDSEKLVESKKNFNLVAVDMNNLKMINDELGHKFGDEALIKVAKALKKFEDYGENCYRMGGDEFEVLCKTLDFSEIDKVCEEINKELSKVEFFPGKPLSIAYGYSRFSATTDKEVNKVMAKADQKMYEKKQQMKKMGYSTRD